MYYGDDNADKMQRRYRKFYSEDGSMEVLNDTQAGTTNFVFYLGGDAYDAPAIWKEVHTSAAVKQNLYYLHRDHLGSIVMITDVNGNVAEKRQFDAWGNVVKLTDGNGNDLTAFVILDRGYTGHEHLFGVALIHMNARLYDPMLHRFLSPDNFVQDPSNTQNFNRYGYVMNNPLIYTDADGNWFLIDDAIAALVGGTINLVSNVFQGNVHGIVSGLAYFGVGAASGVTTLYGGPLAGAAVLGFGNNLTSQVVSKGWGNINFGQLAMSTVLSVGTAWAGGQLSGALSPYMSNLTSGIASPVLSNAITQGATNAVTGFALGTGASLLGGNSLGGALSEGGRGAAMGLGMGAITGAVGGYKYAKNNSLNPWNGRSTVQLAPAQSVGIAPSDLSSLKKIEVKPRLYNADVSGDFIKAQQEWNNIRAQYGLDPTSGVPSWLDKVLPDGSVIKGSFYFGGKSNADGFNIKIKVIAPPTLPKVKSIYIRYKQ